MRAASSGSRLTQNFEGGCRLGSLAGELVESDAELQADFAAGGSEKV